MKKLVLTICIIIGGIQYVSSQDIANHALGVRFGDNDGFGGELTYQKKINEMIRLEVDLGYRNHKEFDAFKLTGIYQWVWAIDDGFNWYAGLGGGIGSWSIDNGFITDDKDGVFINVDGNVGIEYNFEVPLIISLDFRPEIGVVGDYGKDTDLDLALSLRYQF